MASTETPARDAVLVKYLNDAYGKEKQLEQNLEALIGRASNHKTLKKGLQDHLKVTKNQAKGLKNRIKDLGGKADLTVVPGPEIATSAASAVTNVANRAVAMAKGPMQMLRGTGEADNMLRNVRDAFWNEAEEIAHYDVIEAVAAKLNDRETVKLAKQYRREEERMQTLLARELKKLVTAVVRDEVPASERRNGTGRRRSTRRSSSSSRSTSSRSNSRSTSSRSSSSRSSSGGSSGRSAASRRQAAQKAAATRKRNATRSSARSTARSARTTARKAGTTARKAGGAARSTARRATS